MIHHVNKTIKCPILLLIILYPYMIRTKLRPSIAPISINGQLIFHRVNFFTRTRKRGNSNRTIKSLDDIQYELFKHLNSIKNIVIPSILKNVIIIISYIRNCFCLKQFDRKIYDKLLVRREIRRHDNSFSSGINLRLAWNIKGQNKCLENLDRCLLCRSVLNLSLTWNIKGETMFPILQTTFSLSKSRSTCIIQWVLTS